MKMIGILVSSKAMSELEEHVAKTVFMAQFPREKIVFRIFLDQPPKVSMNRLSFVDVSTEAQIRIQKLRETVFSKHPLDFCVTFLDGGGHKRKQRYRFVGAIIVSSSEVVGEGYTPNFVPITETIDWVRLFQRARRVRKLCSRTQVYQEALLRSLTDLSRKTTALA